MFSLCVFGAPGRVGGKNEAPEKLLNGMDIFCYILQRMCSMLFPLSPLSSSITSSFTLSGHKSNIYVIMVFQTSLRFISGFLLIYHWHVLYLVIQSFDLVFQTQYCFLLDLVSLLLRVLFGLLSFYTQYHFSLVFSK